MSKFANYMIVIGGFVLVFYFLGLLPPDASLTAQYLNLLLSPQDIKASPFFITSIAVLGGVLLGAAYLAIKGFSPDLIIFGSFVYPLMSFGWDLILIINKVTSETASAFSLLLFAPLFFVYFLTVIEWWRGVTI